MLSSGYEFFHIMAEFDETDSGAIPRRIRARVPSHKMETNPIYEGVMYETTPGESFKLLLDSSSKIKASHIPPFTKACPSPSPIPEDEVRYSGIKLSNETKPTAACGFDGNIQTLLYKIPNDNHIMARYTDDSSSTAKDQVAHNDVEDELYATLR